MAENEATEVEEPKTLTKPVAELQTIPGFSQGVRDNAAVRMMKLAAPVCPNSRVQMERQPGGGYRPKDKGPNAQNCQLEGRQWWLKCEQRGHDPYFTERVWYTEQDKWETDPEGNDVLVGTKRLRHHARLPNVVQVPISRRLHQGNGVVLSMKNKGRRRLSEIGFREVCQFRNCQVAVTIRSRAFGDYCGNEHLGLIAADAQGVPLVQLTGLEGSHIEQARQKRAAQLREATAFADVR